MGKTVGGSTTDIMEKVKELPRELKIGLGFRVLDAVIMQIRRVSEEVKVHPVTLETKLVEIQNLSYQVHNLTNALEAYTKGKESKGNEIDIVRDTVMGLRQLHGCELRNNKGEQDIAIEDIYNRYLNRAKE